MRRRVLAASSAAIAVGSLALIAAAGTVLSGFVHVPAYCWGQTSPVWTSTMSYTPRTYFTAYVPTVPDPTGTVQTPTTPNPAGTSGVPTAPTPTGMPTGPTGPAQGPGTSGGGPTRPGGPKPSAPRAPTSFAPPTGPSGPSAPGTPSVPGPPTGPGARPTAAPSSPSRPSGPSAPRPGMGDTGSTDAPASGPSRPAGPGLDWHRWWAGERLHFWSDSGRDAGQSRSGRTAGPANSEVWVAALRDLLASNPSWTDRAALAEGLTYCTDPALVPIGVQLAADRQDEVSRLGVLAAARAMGDVPEALGMLRSILQDRQIDGHARGAAAAALGGLNDPAARDGLLRAAKGSGKDVVRVGALIGLGLVGAAADVRYVVAVADGGREETPLRTAAIIALSLMAQSADAGTRAAATKGILRVAKRAGRLPIESRQTLALCLGRVSPTDGLFRALNELCHEDGDMRTRALAAIGWGLLARAHPEHAATAGRALVKRWHKEPQSVRAFLALGLGIGRVRDQRRLVEQWLVGRGDPLHRGAAAVSLGLMGDPASVPALLKQCTNGAPSLRGDSAEALGYIGTPGAADALRAMLQGGKAPAALLSACAYGLGVIGARQDFELLAFMLDHGSPQLRQGAIYALAAYGGSEARDALLGQAGREAHAGVRSLAFYCSGLAMAPRPVVAPGKDLDRSPWAREH